MLNPDIRDQAYQFFIEEVPELLEAIEAGLLSLREDRSTAKVHEVMRAAHSIKGGAASVELDVIKVIAHRLETIFKALYDESVEFDASLETELLQAYDCLRLPLIEQIATGQIDIEQALTAAEPIFAQLEERLSSALAQADNYIPSSSDLGIDMVASIFEIDVAQGIDRLTLVLQEPQAYPVVGELHAQAEVFIGLAELLNLPGFGKIAETALAALQVQPDQATTILKLALADFEAGRQAVLAGDRSEGGSPSPALMALMYPISQTANSQTTSSQAQILGLESDDVFGAELDAATSFSLDLDVGAPLSDLESIASDSVFDADSTLDAELLFSESPNFMDLVPPIETGENDVLEWDAVASNPSAQLSERSEAAEDIVAADPVDLVDLEPQFAGDHFSDGHLANNHLTASHEELLAEESSTASEIAFAEDVFGGLIPSDLFDEDDSVIIGDVDDSSNITDNLYDQIAEIDPVETENTLELENTPELVETGEDLHKATNEVAAEASPSLLLEDTFSDTGTNANLWEEMLSSSTQPHPVDAVDSLNDQTAELHARHSLDSMADAFDAPPVEPAPTIESLLASAEEIFETLPSLAEQPQIAESPSEPTAAPEDESSWKQYLRSGQPQQTQQSTAPTPANLSVRVDIQRLERMNNLVGELAINRNSLSLQNDQMQSSVRDLVERFVRFQAAIGQLQELSDRMLVAPAYRSNQRLESPGAHGNTALIASFDTLEMDRYSLLHFELQDIFEQVMQIEEALGDISLFSAQSSQTLNEQRQKMIQLQNELMWARMLPLGNVLNRFPRVLRDLSAKYNKSVALKLNGVGVLVDKMVLEKLYDPLLHLLRNAFDHGIEVPSARRNQGKAEQGTIEIRAYHRGNQTLIEVVDDGKGLDIQRIGQRAVELGWLMPQELGAAKPGQILDFIFEPGFSTAEQVSELSGRGVGLDVVRAQLRSLKGSVSVTSTLGKGTTFTLRIPLTLTVAKLLTCAVGPTAIAVPSDSIEEILVPKPDQLKQAGGQQFLCWREQLVPIYRMGQLLNYSCAVPERSTSDSLTVVPTPKDWTSPLLVIQRNQHSFAIEVDRLITEQELVIKPFGASIAPPPYTYGCTILGDGSLVPVIDAATLVDLTLNRETSGSFQRPVRPNHHQPPAASQTVKTILVVDDSATLRRMLALTLEKAGYRVLQARDGREALSHLEQGASVQVVICDIEMPNMNGFEFLSQRRQTPEFAKIPVMMLTSRSNDKHRRLAMHLGATAYFSKPYVEHDLLSALQTLLSAAV